MASKSATRQSIIVSFGAEEFHLDQDMMQARKWRDREVVVLDGRSVTGEDIVFECNRPSFDMEAPVNRVVIVDEAQSLKGEDAIEEYIKTKSITDRSTILVAIVRSEKLPKVWSYDTSSKVLIREYKKLKTWESNNEVEKWIARTALRNETPVDEEACSALYALIGYDLYRLNSELTKLQLYVGKGNKITLKHVAETIASTVVPEPWQVAEAVVERNAKKAMNTLSRLYKFEGEETHVQVVGSLARQIERLLIARSMLDKGKEPDEIAGVLDMHPYRFKNALLPHVKKHEVRSLLSHMRRLRDLDVDVKGPSPSKRTLVELTVLAITG